MNGLTGVGNSPHSPMDLPTELEQHRKALTVGELAETLSLSCRQVYSLISRGHIPSYRIAGSVRIDPHAAANWLRAQTV
jgi:excisionase family DNA binding protein